MLIYFDQKIPFWQFMNKEQIMAVVKIFVIRHGQKEGGDENAPLTEKGVQQVTGVAQIFLASVEIRALYASTLDRTVDTVIYARNAAARFGEGMSEILTTNVERRVRLGFTGLPLDEYAAAAAKSKEMKDRQEIVTVANWIKWMPTYAAAAIERFGEAILQVAAEVYEEFGENTSVLIGSHSPLAELLVLDPAYTPALGEAGLIKYVVEIDSVSDMATITESTVIFPGYF